MALTGETRNAPQKSLSTVCFLHHGSYTDFSGIEESPLVDLPSTEFQSYTVACLHDRMWSGQLLCGGVLMLNLGLGGM